MKEITRISLASLPYNIEIEAKKVLEKYLSLVERSLGDDSDTMKEIEARVAEILAERGVIGDKVISGADVSAVAAQLGEPGDFIDSDAVESDVAKAAKNPKKLMRDGENRILGGVCSGIANYFGWDATWVRLAAVVLTFVTSGFGVVVYSVLWIAMPKAITAADKLVANGEAVTLASLKATSSRSDEIGEPTLVVILRWLTGLGLVAGALSVVGLVVVGIFTVFVTGAPYLEGWSSQMVLPGTIAMAFAGMSLAALMGLMAYMLFTKKTQKGVVIAAVVVFVIGMLAMKAGVDAYFYSGNQYHDAQRKAQVSKTLAADLAGIKKLTIESGQATVNYHVAAGQLNKAELRYNTLGRGSQPIVKISRSADTAVINLKFSDENCHGLNCGHAAVLDIYGPALESINLKSGSLNYETSAQEKLSTVQAKDTELVLYSTGVLKNVEAKQANNASMEAGGANIENLKLSAENEGHFRGATLASLELNIPATCSLNKTSSVSIESAGRIVVNSSPWNGENTKCLKIDRGDQVNF